MALALAAFAAGCGGDAGGEAVEHDAAVVLTQEDLAVVETRSLSAGAVLTGTLDPYRVVEVRAQVPGLLTHLAVDRGQSVRQGQVLARIEAEGIRGAAASARAAVAAAEANVALARRQLASARTLHEAGAMSDIEFQQAQAGWEAAQAQLSAAAAQALGAGESASRATVNAPISGEVSARAVSEGEAVNPGETLLTIVNTSILELAGQVPVGEAASIRPGLPVEFTIAEYPGATYTGTVARVDPAADPATRQVGVYVRLPNHSRNLVGGLFATGRILSAGERTALVVPRQAVRGSGTDAYVIAIRGGSAEHVPVELGLSSEREGVVEILAGLEAGETVVVAPGEIRQGTAVRLASAAGVVAEGER